jgi:phosphate transport system permease protein
MGGASLLAGGLSLAMIMLPVFARTTEEALKAIPSTVTEAGLGLGLPRRKVIVHLLVRSSTPAILTGFFLAIARVGGEAAPLLFTALGSNSWPQMGPGAMTEQIASLPVTIYELARDPFPGTYQLAWGASLVLVALILAIRLSTNLYVHWRYGQGGVVH